MIRILLSWFGCVFNRIFLLSDPLLRQCATGRVQYTTVQYTALSFLHFFRSVHFQFQLSIPNSFHVHNNSVMITRCHCVVSWGKKKIGTVVNNRCTNLFPSTIRSLITPFHRWRTRLCAACGCYPKIKNEIPSTYLVRVDWYSCRSSFCSRLNLVSVVFQSWAISWIRNEDWTMVSFCC